jgi:mxaC protein
MTGELNFAHPWLLLALPLVALPLLRRRRDRLRFSHLPWLPQDRAGRMVDDVWNTCAVVVLAALILALAGPERALAKIIRSGRGAEVLILIDRSRSMDDRMLPLDWRTIDPIIRTQQARSRGPQKSQVARDLLSNFAAERPHDRFCVMFFSTGPLMVVPFTQHGEMVQAGISAGGVGRGLADTDVGSALTAAIAAFDQRAYSGSRLILLVSDGGAQLDEAIRKRLRAGFLRNRIALSWLYLRSINAPRLDDERNDAESVPEIALHRYFQRLPIPYAAYQAEDPDDLHRAIADVARQQNSPIEYLEELPRKDYSQDCLVVATGSCLILLLLSATQRRSWL